MTHFGMHRVGLGVLAGVACVAMAEEPYALVWQVSFGSPASDAPRAIAVDGSGAILVAGNTGGLLEPGGTAGGGTDAFLVRLDAHGGRVWTRQVGLSGEDFGAAAAFDPAGNALLAGSTSHLFGVGEAFVASFRPDGQPNWGQELGAGPGLNDTADARGMATDSAGNVYLCGAVWGGAFGPWMGDFDAFVAKLDPEGRLLWSRTLGTETDEYAQALAVDADGNAWVVGLTFGGLGGPSAGDYDPFLARYGPDGELLWVRQWGTFGSETATSVAVDGDGNAVVGASGEIVKYDIDGNRLWRERTRNTPRGVAVDAGGAIYVAVGLASEALQKYDPSGDLLWTRAMDFGLYAVAVDAAGEVYATGQNTDSDVFVARLTPSGCYADFDGSGSLDLFDFLAFQNAFDAGDAPADCDGSGALNLFDFLCFQNAFDAGCG